MARKPKGEVARSETLAIRLDPRTRYMLELASRIQHRTLSSVVEWMINNSLKDIPADEAQSLASAQVELWDIEEPDRLINLALYNYNLLSFDEQKIWKVIKECEYFWREKNASSGESDAPNSWTWKVTKSNIFYDRVRSRWDEIKHLVLTGEKPKNGYPKFDVCPKDATAWDF